MSLMGISIDKIISRHPFNSPSADVIIRSSDNIDIRAVKAFLSFASPVFEGMFGIPQPATVGESDMVDGLPVVTLTEPAETLIKVLRLCYPAYTGAEFPQSVNGWEEVVEAVHKYQMDHVLASLMTAKSLMCIMRSDPLRVFAVAVRLQIAGVARQAAQKTLGVVVTKCPCFRLLEVMAGANFRHLSEYHLECGDTASRVASSWWDKWSSVNRTVWRGCPQCLEGSDTCGEPFVPRTVYLGKKSRRETKVIGLWWCKYLEEVSTALKEKPTTGTAKSADLMAKALERAQGCESCREEASSDLAKFVEELAGEVDRAVSKASASGVADFHF
ncbi:hypothetical protein BV22DRAFT_1131284 [Leucogyrophana mollusca]|uniref:Uncharacterized protein n=1 Tax=Leucogyrophana mollusca TaxID=85980 RepID=A0ACB8BCD1_9AGAM|nr:hypothetical protein BV22DRAFT_1131284 [Leucogyrophana mollusca]